MYAYKLIDNDECLHDGFSIVVEHNGVEVGHVDVGMEFEVGENSFEPYADQPVYDELLADMDQCLCVHTLDVNAAHRNAGLGTQLMQRAMAVMSQEYPGVPCYLNASPMGDCMDLETLIEFYTKFGFKMLLKFAQHRNALLLKAA